MSLFRKESLEALRQRIDLIDVLSSHLDLKRSGASYKAVCPFHDEKTPSFMVQKGESHYHCFGCGAHGDAIQFLMSHVRLSFSEAVEQLAQRFHVPLEYVEGENEQKGPSKKLLQDALEIACEFYHFALLYTPEGHEALRYLYRRGIDLDFIKQFRLGLAPKAHGVFRKVMQAKSILDDLMVQAGLLVEAKQGGLRDFFYDRIMIPVHNASGAVIGFSARKYKESTTGGKYVNTAETTLFKKSRVLFGLNYARKRIAKERKAIIVEGQLDALRLIQEGFNITVAGQGTAFGEGHASELLALGVNSVYLALDPDLAGQEAAVKIGNIFQKSGVEVYVVSFPKGHDPDSFLREEGPQSFLELLQASVDYLTFLVKRYGLQLNMESPAGKQELIRLISTQIRGWDQELMVHESLRKLARLVQVPEEMIGINQHVSQNVYFKKSDYAGLHEVDPDRVLECDLLRWILFAIQTHPHFVDLCRINLEREDFRVEACRRIYDALIASFRTQNSTDLISLAIALQNQEAQQLLSDLLHKKVNMEKAESLFLETLQKILERNWMQKREEIKMKIQGGQCSEEEALELVKRFEEIKRDPPVVKKLEIES